MFLSYMTMVPSSYSTIGWLAVAVGIACSLVKIISLVVCRIYFHPLSRFPGPPLARLSDLWTVYYSIKGQSHLKAFEAHQKYGPIVRFGPNKLSISSVSAVQETYHSKLIQKSQVFETITPAPNAFSTFTAIDKEMHRRKRKAFSQAFSDQAIENFELTILRHADIFVSQVVKAIPLGTGERWTEPLNMTALARYYATDVMGDFGFGKSFDVQISDENRFLLKATDGATVVAGMYCQYPKLKHYGLGRLVALAGMSTKEHFGKLVRRLIDQRLSEPSETKADLLHFLSGNIDGKMEERFSLNEIWAESRFTLIAGAETTATAIASSLFYLSRYPECYVKLTIILRTTFKSANEIRRGINLTQCEYLWACVDEAMRLSPSVVAVLWREVRENGFVIDGEHIPAGCDLGVSVYCPHHDDSVFPEPFTFKPERWLDTGDVSDRDRLTRQRQAFNPFGLGPRKCIGYKMAYTEIVLCLAKALWCLDMRRPSGKLGTLGAGMKGASSGRERENEFQLYEHITCRHDGPYLEWSWRTDKETHL